MAAVRLFSSISLILLFLFCGCGRRPAVLRGFADGWAAWWSLDLYADSTFDIHIGAGDFAGQYTLCADTIFLEYGDKLPPDSDLPRAYWINRDGGTLSDIVWDVAQQCYVVQNRNWMKIAEDHLPR